MSLSLLANIVFKECPDILKEPRDFTNGTTEIFGPAFFKIRTREESLGIEPWDETGQKYKHMPGIVIGAISSTKYLFVWPQFRWE